MRGRSAIVSRGARQRIAAAVTGLLAAAGPARAEPAPVGDAGGALPGFVRVGAAAPLDPGLAVAALAGYGHRGAVIADEDNHHRAAIDLAASLSPLSWLAVAARFSGRYDRHTGTGLGQDSGWVGDPRVAARAVTPVGAGVWLAGQVGLWLPGRDAPSLEPSAATVDMSGLVTWVAPGGRLALGGLVGFRVDRSAESVDRPEELSPSDRMALGVSDSNAVLVGAGASVRAGGIEWVGEWSLDALVGERAPGGRQWPMRLGLGARRALGDTLALQVVAEASLSGAPAIEPIDPEVGMAGLYPVEPRLQALAGLTFRPGRARADRRRLVEAAESPPSGAAPRRPGQVSLTVVSETGEALAGAEVALQPVSGPARATRTRADGSASVTGVDAGRARVEVRHPGHRPRTVDVDVPAGGTAAARVELDLDLPPGQLRGLVRSFRGRPLPARLTVRPLGVEVRCDQRGEFELDLPPGSYQVSIEADGYHPQQRQVVIEQDGVTILNVDLRR